MAVDRPTPKGAITDAITFYDTPPFDQNVRDDSTEVWVPNILIDRYMRVLGDAELRVLLWLVHQCWWHGIEQVSHADMVGEGRFPGCGVSKSSLAKSLRRLEDLGLLIKTRFYGRGGRKLANTYRLRWVDLRERPEDAARRHEQEAYLRRYARAHERLRTLRTRLLGKPGVRCARCQSQTDLTLDLVVPFKQGGLPIEDNVQVLCRPCNSRKGART